MRLWIYLCEAPIYGKENPYFDNFSAKDLIARTDICVQHLTSCKKLSLNPCRKFSVLRFFARKTIESWYKTNCYFETTILHYIDAVGREYILCIRLRGIATPPNTEYIFFLLQSVSLCWNTVGTIVSPSLSHLAMLENQPNWRQALTTLCNIE